MYTLSSPTALAVDAACHPRASALLGALSDVFRLTETGVTQLGLSALDADPVATALAWGMVELVDAATPSASGLLRTTARGCAPTATIVARARLGDVRDVTRLVVTEAARWPDAPRVVVAGSALVASSAAAAAGAVSAWWTHPDLPDHHADVLTGPWRAMFSHEGALTAPSAALYGPRGSAVVELLSAAARGHISLVDLAQVGWPAGAWAMSMHRAAWAAHRAGRLHEQHRAVIDLTAAFVGAHDDASPEQLRMALPALHALTVAEVVGDVLEPGALADLRVGAVAL